MDMGCRRVMDMTTLLVEEGRYLSFVAMRECYRYGVSKGQGYDYITGGG